MPARETDWLGPHAISILTVSHNVMAYADMQSQFARKARTCCAMVRLQAWIEPLVDAPHLLKSQFFKVCSMLVYVLNCLLKAGQLDENDSLTGNCILLSRTCF